jgi:hypothetical protein
MADVTSWQGAKGAPRISKSDLLKRYRDRIKMSQRWREDEGYDATWRRLIDIYRGKTFSGVRTGEDQIAVNVAFSTINVIAPSVAVNNPKISVNAAKEEFEDQAVITEAVVNYWWRHYEVKPEFRRAVNDFLILGHGWLKCGWRYDEEEVPLSYEEQDGIRQDLNAQLDQYAMDNPDEAASLPSSQDVEDGLPESKWEATEDRPYVERVNPFDVYVDPEATDMTDIKWIAQRVVRPLEEVQVDKRYSQAKRKRLKADAAVNPKFGDDRVTRRTSDDVKRVTLWEFYDLQRNTMCVFPEDGDEFLVEPTSQPYPFGVPFVMVRNYDVPNHFYPIGDLEALEPLQRELNATRSAMVNHRKKYARKYLARSSALSGQARNALESDQDNQIAYIEDDNIPLGDVIQPLPISMIDPQMYNYSNTIEQDIDRVSGVNEYMRGALPEIRRTATEASIIQDAANARAADKLSIIEGSIRDVARLMVQLAQVYVTGDQVARVVGTNSQQMWVQFSREDIVGEFDFEVEAGSTQPNNDATKRQQAMQLLSVLAPYAQAGVVDPRQLVTHVLQQGFGMKNPQKLLAAPQPMAPPGMPGMPPAAPQQGDLPAPAQDAMQQAALPAPGGASVPPELLAQLQMQMGNNGQQGAPQ